MLGALFVACATAVATILFSIDSNVAGPCIASSFMIAVACAAMLPMMPRRDEFRFRISGIVWIVAMSTDALLGIFLIWEDFLSLRVSDFECTAAAMFILFAGTCVVIVPLRHMEATNGPVRRVAMFSSIAIGLVTLSMVAVMLVNSVTRIGSLQVDEGIGYWAALMGASVTIGAASCGLIPGVATWRRVISWIGIVAAVLVAGGWMQIIRANPPMTDPIYSWEFLGAGVCGGVAIYSVGRVLQLGRLEGALIPYIAFLTVVSGVLASRAVVIQNADSWVARSLFATLLIEGCLALTVIILYRIGRKATLRDWQISGAEVACPRCGKRGHFGIGEHACKECSCRILLAFRDTKCPKCHHDVQQLQPGRPCPECGVQPERSAGNYFVAGATGAATCDSSGAQIATSSAAAATSASRPSS